MKNKVNHILSKANNVLFAYLFGSYAKGDFTDKSDIDIAVYLQNDNFDAKLTLHHTLETALHKDVDMVYLNDVKNIYLLEAIITQGILIKDSEERAMFEVNKQHEIIDFKNFKKYIDAA
jgi:predicted nucleotidyltransferase